MLVALNKQEKDIFTELMLDSSFSADEILTALAEKYSADLYEDLKYVIDELNSYREEM